MSVNALEPGPRGPFTLLQDEQLLTGPHPADIELRIPATISGPKRTESAKGSLYVTDKRVVFSSDTSGAGSSTAPPAYDAPPVLKSLAIPYPVLLATKFELPIFSANYILLNFLPDPTEADNGLPAPGRGAHLELKVCINDGQGHGVWKRIEGERCRLEERRADDEVLPAYQA